MCNTYTCIVEFRGLKQETVHISCHSITLGSGYSWTLGQKKGLLFIKLMCMYMYILCDSSIPFQ